MGESIGFHIGVVFGALLVSAVIALGDNEIIENTQAKWCIEEDTKAEYLFEVNTHSQ